MEQEILKILLNYPIQVDKIMTLKFRRVWKVFSKEKQYVLKALSFPKAETDFILGAMEHLTENGFQQFNAIVKTKNGDMDVKYESRYYFLSEFISGAVPSFESDSDLRLLGGFLGEFHKKTQGYFPENPYAERVKWDNWEKMIVEKKENLLDFGEKNPRATFFDISYCRYIPYFMEDLDKSVLFFQGEGYKKLWQEEKKLGVFCHHDLAHHNFMVGELPHLIDFDYALLDIRCHDLANLLGKVLKANHWETSKAIVTLEAYDKVRSLSKEECDAIKSMLRFPQDYWQCAFARYVEGDVSHHSEKKMKHWLKERTLRRNALQNLETLF